jgi:uncharacterized membrane protein
VSNANKLITTAITAILTMGLSAPALAEHDMGIPDGMEKCYGIAKAGQNDCGTASHHCGGEARSDGEKDAWIFVPTGVCNKIVGGSNKAPSET